MDEWQDVAFALQAVFVCFGAGAVVVDAFGVPGVVDPFVLGGGLFALGFALGGVATFSNDDSRGALVHLLAALGWVLVVASDGRGRVVVWVGIALLAVAGVALCYRAATNGRVAASVAG